MTTPTLLCLGYGYTARHVGALAMADGWKVKGTTRSPEKADALNAEGVAPILWGETLDTHTFEGVDAVLVSAPPDANGCPALRAAGEAIAAHAGDISWIGYLSTNGVYGDHDGAWVDENTTPRPTTERSRRRLSAETAWRAFGEAADIPVVIFRLPGIYGPGRSVFDRIRAGAAQRIFKEGQVFSRAHVEDIACVIKASLDHPEAGTLFNIADDAPSPPQDVIEHACEFIGVAPPPLVPIEDANLSEMARSFYQDNKRVDNSRMKEALGVELLYPSYTEGLRAILETEKRA